MSGLTFRFAERADAPTIAALIESGYRGDESRRGWTTEADLLDGDRTSVAEIEAYIADPNARFIMAFECASLVGCALIKNEAGEGYFGMFAVKPALQGSGHGKQILAHAEKTVRDLWHCPVIAMTVISIREDLIAFYERRGYKRSATKPFPFDREPGAKRTDFHFVVLKKTIA